MGSGPVWWAGHIVDALLDGFNSSPVKLNTPTLRGAGPLPADAPQIKTLNVEMRQNDKKAQKNNLDLVLKPQIHTAAKAKMAEKSPG